MRTFYLLTVVMVLFFAAAFAGDAEQRSLRVAGDVDTEERIAFSSLKDLGGLKGKLQTTKSGLKAKYTKVLESLKGKLQKAKSYIKAKYTKIMEQRRIDSEIVSSIKRGESKNSVLKRLNVKPTTDAKGREVFSANDPVVQRYEHWVKRVHFKGKKK